MHLNLADRPSSRPLLFYGRRQGRTLRGLKKDLLTDLLPRLTVTPQNLPAFLASNHHHVLEIGFGGGEHLSAHSLAFPHKSFLGIEVFKNGIAHLLETIHIHNLENIRLFPQDGRLLFPFIPKGSLKEIYVLFPDPWPKKKHHQRRLLDHTTCQLFSDWLKPSGRLVIASDHPDYLQHIKLSAFQTPGLKQLDKDSFHKLVITRYEQKALKAGRHPEYLIFERL